jgi:hypothetical protein
MSNFFGDIAKQPGVAPQAAPGSQQSLDLTVSPLKRMEFKGFMEGMEKAFDISESPVDQPSMLPPPMQPPMMGGQPPMMPPQMPSQGMGMPQQPIMMANHGGVVDIFDPVYMRYGGDPYAEKDKGRFSTNITAGPGQTISSASHPKVDIQKTESLSPIQEVIPDKELLEDALLMNELRDDLGYNMSTDPRVHTSYMEDRLLDENTNVDAPPTHVDATKMVAAPWMERLDSDATESVSTFDPAIASLQGSQHDPQFRHDQGFIDSYNHPLTQYVSRFTDPIFEAQGFDMGTDAGRYQAYLATQRNVARQQQDEIKRKKDQDRLEAEQRRQQELRDMIAGMLPEQATSSPSAPIVSTPTLPEDGEGITYPDPVVPSDRIPGFDLANLSPYPTFGGFNVPPITPGLSPELLRRLFAMQGENMPPPVIALKSGGEVLDNTIDNFLGSLRSVA